jgi:1-acyl-sn-glycerol-3-phosphate acyltransferase
LPVYFGAMPFGMGARNAVARQWHRGAAALCGLNIRVSGTPVTDRPVVFCANHVSYLDIPVLASIVDATFVAKAEVGSWPLFGFLSKLQRTVFIDRKAVRAGDQRTAVRSRMDRGESLIIFAEGTSSDGARVLPFKTSIFGAVEAKGDEAPATVQPVSIAYPRYADGRLLVGDTRAAYAWFGDMTMADHLLGVFGREGARVDVIFHAPVSAADFADRKALAKHCEAAVAAGVKQANDRLTP